MSITASVDSIFGSVEFPALRAAEKVWKKRIDQMKNMKDSDNTGEDLSHSVDKVDSSVEFGTWGEQNIHRQIKKEVTNLKRIRCKYEENIGILLRNSQEMIQKHKRHFDLVHNDDKIDLVQLKMQIKKTKLNINGNEEDVDLNTVEENIQKQIHSIYDGIFNNFFDQYDYNQEKEEKLLKGDHFMQYSWLASSMDNPKMMRTDAEKLYESFDSKNNSLKSETKNTINPYISPRSSMDSTKSLMESLNESLNRKKDVDTPFLRLSLTNQLSIDSLNHSLSTSSLISNEKPIIKQSKSPKPMMKHMNITNKSESGSRNESEKRIESYDSDDSDDSDVSFIDVSHSGPPPAYSFEFTNKLDDSIDIDQNNDEVIDNNVRKDINVENSTQPHRPDNTPPKRFMRDVHMYQNSIESKEQENNGNNKKESEVLVPHPPSEKSEGKTRRPYIKPTFISSIDSSIDSSTILLSKPKPTMFTQMRLRSQQKAKELYEKRKKGQNERKIPLRNQVDDMDIHLLNRIKQNFGVYEMSKRYERKKRLKKVFNEWKDYFYQNK